MKLNLYQQEIDLDITRIMGVLDVHPDHLEGADEMVKKALAMQENGAQFIEVGLNMQPGTESTEEQEMEFLTPMVKALSENTKLFIAVNTSHAQVMDASVAAGACMIIDPKALMREDALSTAKNLNVPVCIVFDPQKEFVPADEDDPTSAISEFLYERMDACLNAGFRKSNLIIDPSMGLGTSLEYRLKMLGRIKTFKSFALPICISVPRSIPYEDPYLNTHKPAVIALAIYMVQEGVNIIRTRMVGDVALALDTWQALNRSSRPFKLTRAIADRFLKRT